jgi:hypothetical protein
MAADNDERDRVWEIYQELGLIDRHFNTTQTNCRALASTWLLAALAGIGIVISKEISVGFSKELIIAGLSLGSAIGLSLLWVLDLLFYQRLLDAAYIEARNLELAHAWLPQVRNNMRKLLGGHGLSMVLLFYVVTAETMVFISEIALGLWLRRLGQRACAYWLEMLAYTVLPILLPIFMNYLTPRTPKSESQLAGEGLANR